MTEWRTKWKDSILADNIWIAIAEYDDVVRAGNKDEYQRAANAIDAAIEALIEACVSEELDAATRESRP